MVIIYRPIAFEYYMIVFIPKKGHMAEEKKRRGERRGGGERGGGRGGRGRGRGGGRGGRRGGGRGGSEGNREGGVTVAGLSPIVLVHTCAQLYTVYTHVYTCIYIQYTWIPQEFNRRTWGRGYTRTHTYNVHVYIKHIHVHVYIHIMHEALLVHVYIICRYICTCSCN